MKYRNQKNQTEVELLHTSDKHAFVRRLDSDDSECLIPIETFRATYVQVMKFAELRAGDFFMTSDNDICVKIVPVCVDGVLRNVVNLATGRMMFGDDTHELTRMRATSFEIANDVESIPADLRIRRRL